MDLLSVDGPPVFAARLLPPEPIKWLLASVSFETSLAPALAFLAGLVLTLSPISWPSIPAVMTVLTPAARAGTADGLTPEWGEEPQPLSQVRGALVVLGFDIGMDGVIATIGALAVSVTYLLVRGAVALSLLAAVLLAVVGLRLVTRRASLCSRTRALPPDPLRAISAGAVFAVVGCPGCAPIAIGVGGAAAASGSVLISVLAIAGFVLGRWLALYSFAAAGGRLLGRSVARSGGGWTWSSAHYSSSARCTTCFACCSAPWRRCPSHRGSAGRMTDRHCRADCGSGLEVTRHADRVPRDPRNGDSRPTSRTTSSPAGDTRSRLPAKTKGNDMELVFLLITLLCPLSMVGLMGWWAWSMRRPNKRASDAPVRSASDENEITRMRAQLDQLQAQARDEKSPATG